MKRTAIATAVIVLVGATGVAGTASAQAGASTARSAAATISVDPSTGLDAATTVTVTASGWPAKTLLGMAECTSGAIVTGSCDFSTTQYPTTDDNGDAQTVVYVHAEIYANDGVVDCTVAGACEIGVAVLADVPNTTVTAPISFAPLPAPTAGSIDAPTAPVARDRYLDVTASDFAPGVALDWATCTHGATSANECANPGLTFTDEAGADTNSVLTPSSLETHGGDTVDCTVAKACDVSVWDTRDFSARATSPITLAPEVAGSLTVSPSTDLLDGDRVTVQGSDWPAREFLELDECTSQSYCVVFDSAVTDDQGRVGKQFTVKSHDVSGQATLDCHATPCSIIATWNTASLKALTASQPIEFATGPVAETAHYTADELAAVDGAATTLDTTPAQLQRDASWALAWVLGLTHTTHITPVADAGPRAVTTNWTVDDADAINSVAVSEGATIPEFEKTGSMFVAYILAISQAHR